MTSVVVRPGATDEYTIPYTHGWERRQILGRMRRLKIQVPREEARNANLNAKVDKIELSGVDTVRLTDVQTGGSTWTLTGYSAEWDANRAGFTAGGDVREGDDQTLITNLVGEVSSWTAGTINSYSGPLSFVFSHAHRHEALRRIEQNVSGEIQFRDFGTVDYLPRLGEPRTTNPDTYTNTGGTGTTVDVSGRDTVVAELVGAGGGDPSGVESFEGSSGGYIKTEIDVSDLSELVVYSGEEGAAPAGGVGLYNGGDGYDGTDVTTWGGGGSTSITDGAGNELVHADAGGGNGQSFLSGDTYGGGGGARGGAGGVGNSGSGMDAEGTGNGGDGSAENGAGEDGGQEIIDTSRVTLVDSQTGGGNKGDGEITLSELIQLSSTAGTIEESIRITERGRELDGTHIRVLGAHEGEAQLFVNLVPQDDPATYENEVRYSTPRWSAAEDTDWDRWANKDVTDQATLEEEAASLGEELKESLVKAETVVPTSVGLNVGDTVRVVKDDADLDRSMRVHRLTRQAGTYADTDSDAAVVDKVHLSTRTTAQYDDDKTLEDIRQFNTGFQGSSVAVTAGPFGKAVDGTHPLEFNFKYPQLEYENSAELHISGESYRIDSQGAAAGGNHTHDVNIGATSDENTAYGRVSQRENDLSLAGLTSGWQTLDTWSITTETSEVYLNTTMYDFIGLDDGEIAEINVRVQNTDTLEYYPNQGGSGIQVTRSSEVDNFGTGNVTIGIPGDLDFDDLEAQVELNWQSGSGELDPVIKFDWVAYGTHQHFFDTVESSDASGDHTHAPQPGIYTTADTPSGVDVAINGTTVATNIGSGTFETVVDVPGEFLNDAWNTVEVSSDTLGRIEVSAFVSGYKQIGTR